MPLDVIETLCELVRRPSVNPMGRAVAGDEFYEHRVTDYLQDLFQQLGWRWQRQAVAPGRDNILARIDGDPSPEDGGSLLLFEAHQDTVPVDGMTIPPWTAQVRDGRVYGRGACDVKGALACILAALSRLAEEPPAGRPTVVVACTINEEYGGTGALAVPQLWQADGGLLPRPPDAVIVSEPTALDVVVAHKGLVRWRCSTRGRAAHSSQPQHGDNAIYLMALVVTALERYAREVIPQLAQHRLLSPPTLSVGLISGGISVNTIPDSCTIEIDRRLLPQEPPQAAVDHARAHLAAELGDAAAAVEHEPPYGVYWGLSDERNAALATALSRTAQEAGGSGGLIGVAYGTDAPAFSRLGIPTVVLGTGAIDQANTADEWVAVDQLHAATGILYRFASRFRAHAG